jgi:colicin import membrane protein
MAVTKEQIFPPLDELAAGGQKPTLEAIRQRTGGSYTTISPALNEWKARQATAAAPLREPAPQAVADRLAELGADVWAVALDLANARLAVEREALEKARAELEADRNEATELADKLASDVEALQSRLASIEAAEAAARGEADELRASLPLPRNRRTPPRPAPRRSSAAPASCARNWTGRTGTPTRRAGLAEQQKASQAAAAQLDQVRGELVKAQAKAEADQEAHQEQRKTAAAEAHRMAERLTAAQANATRRGRDASAAREEAARLAGQLTAHQEQNAALLARIQPAADRDKPAKGRK